MDCEAKFVSGILTAVGAMAAGVPLPMATAIGAIAPLAQAFISVNRGRKSLVRDSKVKYLVRLASETEKAM